VNHAENLASCIGEDCWAGQAWYKKEILTSTSTFRKALKNTPDA
jgi:hypothetical protein